MLTVQVPNASSSLDNHLNSGGFSPVAVEAVGALVKDRSSRSTCKRCYSSQQSLPRDSGTVKLKTIKNGLGAASYTYLLDKDVRKFPSVRKGAAQSQGSAILF